MLRDLPYRPRAFTGPRAEERAERAGHWFRALAGVPRSAESAEWCVRNGVQLTKATAENVGSAGGFLAPFELDAAIIAVRETVGAFRRAAQVRPARSGSKARPR